jgi:septum formation protein
MMKAAGLKFQVVAPDFDEAFVKSTVANLPVFAIARYLARGKAESLTGRFPQAIIIGSDQTLEFEGALISKPQSRQDALNQLQMLNGKTHKLHSSIACIHGSARAWTVTQTARLTMRKFSDAFLHAYLDDMGAEVMSTVGGYKIEGLGLQMFERISGDHHVILGMPLLPLLKFLRSKGAIAS